MRYRKYWLLLIWPCFSCITLNGQPIRTVPEKKISPPAKTTVKPKTVVVEKNKDTDGDGLLDKTDNCPDQYGLPSNNGCPGAPQPIETPKATLKIVSDVNANLYVEGVLKTSLTAGVAYNLPLDRGIYSIKIISSKYSVYEVKEAYKVENTSQLDYWKVELLDDEKALIQKERGFKMAQKANELVNMLNECMNRGYSKPLGSTSAYKKKERTLTLTGQKINFTERFELGSKTVTRTDLGYYVADATTLRGYQISKVGEKYSEEGAYLVQILCKTVGTIVFKDTERPDRNSTNVYNYNSFSVYVNGACFTDLEEKLKKFFAE